MIIRSGSDFDNTLLFWAVGLSPFAEYSDGTPRSVAAKKVAPPQVGYMGDLKSALKRKSMDFSETKAAPEVSRFSEKATRFCHIRTLLAHNPLSILDRWEIALGCACVLCASIMILSFCLHAY